MKREFQKHWDPTTDFAWKKEHGGVMVENVCFAVPSIMQTGYIGGTADYALLSKYLPKEQLGTSVPVRTRKTKIKNLHEHARHSFRDTLGKGENFFFLFNQTAMLHLPRKRAEKQTEASEIPDEMMSLLTEQVKIL